MRASKKFITHTVIFLFILYLTGVSFAAEEQKEEMKLVNKIVTISTYEGITRSLFLQYLEPR